jgi:translation elongation factor EF-1alpha
VKTLDIKCPVSVGQKMFLHLQGQKVQVKVRKILKIYNDDNSTVKNNSIFIPKNFNANVIVDCEEKICAELYGNIKQLGRIALRGEGETIAIGFIMEFVA